MCWARRAATSEGVDLGGAAALLLQGLPRGAELLGGAVHLRALATGLVALARDGLEGGAPLGHHPVGGHQRGGGLRGVAAGGVEGPRELRAVLIHQRGGAQSVFELGALAAVALGDLAGLLRDALAGGDLPLEREDLLVLAGQGVAEQRGAAGGAVGPGALFERALVTRGPFDLARARGRSRGSPEDRAVVGGVGRGSVVHSHAAPPGRTRTVPLRIRARGSSFRQPPVRGTLPRR